MGKKIPFTIDLGDIPNEVFFELRDDFLKNYLSPFLIPKGVLLDPKVDNWDDVTIDIVRLAKNELEFVEEDKWEDGRFASERISHLEAIRETLLDTADVIQKAINHINGAI